MIIKKIKTMGTKFAENVVRKLNIPQNQVASVTMWDLPGREDMDIRESYFRNVDAAIGIILVIYYLLPILLAQ